MSVLYLALLSLLYLLITSNYLPLSSSATNLENKKEKIYIELSQDGMTTVKSLNSSEALSKIKSQYGIDLDLKSGDSITFNNNLVLVDELSGRKKISLGIPIGLNSASSEDLEAIPGIGSELATRIINYRDTVGKFQSVDELDKVEGIGRKKLFNIRRVVNLD